MQIFKQVTANNISLEPYQFIKELAMEAYLLENEEILNLDATNFTEVEILDAEIALKKGSRKGDGRIDILANYGGEYLAIVELKLNEINEDSLLQLEGYLRQKEQILKKGEYWTNEETEPKWIGILVGNSISAGLQSKIENGYLIHDETPLAAITLNRFRSTDRKEIFVISDTYFKFNYSNKDYSKFIFNNQEYNKGRLVNAVIREYVNRYPDITYSKLKEAFPDSIQGNAKFGVFTQLDEAQKIFDGWGHKRHYIKPEETIQLTDQTIATCTQWNPLNIKKFVNKANELGMDINLK
jgi:hypothetical protein